MGYYYRGAAGIKCFEPDDTPTEMWVRCGSHGIDNVNLADIIDRCKAKWGNEIDLSKCAMTAHHLNIDCIGYDHYDAADYENYLKIELLL